MGTTSTTVQLQVNVYLQTSWQSVFSRHGTSSTLLICNSVGNGCYDNCSSKPLKLMPGACWLAMKSLLLPKSFSHFESIGIDTKMTAPRNQQHKLWINTKHFGIMTVWLWLVVVKYSWVCVVRVTDNYYQTSWLGVKNQTPT